MPEFVCLDCTRSTQATDACPQCGGKLIPVEGISKILEIIPYDESDDQPVPPLPPDVEQAAAKPENILDRYILVEVVGQGGMGRVYRAWHSTLERYVALKVMSGISRFEKEHFLREGRIAASLRHPNIIPVYDLGATQGAAGEIYYLCMEFINGVGITRSKLARDLRIKALAAVARALDFCHKKGVIHRDIKPENILIDDLGTPYLTDFGLAKEVHTAGTRSSIVFGTPSYMSPEQARGDKAGVDHRADIYSLGATLYEILCGRPPFTGDQPYQIIEALLTKEPVAPGRLVAGLQRDLEIICLKALEKIPEDRYASAAEFADDLEHALADEPIRARPPSALERARRLIKQHPSLLLASVGLVVLLVFVLSIVGVQSAARDRERILRELVLKAGRSIDQFDAEYLEPPHDIRPSMSMLFEAVAACNQAGEVPEALFERGRAEMRLNSLDEAIDCLTRAIEASGESRYYLERGLAYLKVYQEHFDKLLQTQVVSDKEEYQRVQREAWEWKDRALADLRKAAADPQVGAGQLEYAQALIEYTDGDMLPALRRVAKLQQSVEGPDKRLRADLFALSGDILQALREYDKAEQAFLEALNIKRSHPEYRRKAGLAALYRAVHTSDPNLARTAVAHFQAALDLDREYVGAIYGRGTAYQELARLGKDVKLLELAIEDFTRIIDKSDRYRQHALHQRALARVSLAEQRAGEDVKALLDQACDDMGRALEKRGSPALYMDFGSMLLASGRNELTFGRDPLPTLDRALQAFSNASDHASAGEAYYLRARYLQGQSQDPVADLQKAIDEYRRAGDSNEILYNLSQAQFALAYHYGSQEATHAESARAIQEALQSINAVAKASGETVGVLLERGKMHHFYGTLLSAEPAKARPQLDQSLADFSKVLAVDNRQPQGYFLRAQALIARARLSQGALDRADLQEAQKDLKQAVILDPGLSDLANPLLGWLRTFVGDER